MATQYIGCPLCGFEFDQQDTLCAHGCPLGAMCNLLRCPSCEYEFPGRSRSVSWIRRLFRRINRKYTRHPEGGLTIRDLAPGDRAIVVAVDGDVSRRHNALAVFGLVPEARATVLQQRPACVIRVDQTELALDPDIAGQIRVSRVE